MPGKDGTGPLGQGPIAGRRAGLRGRRAFWFTGLVPRCGYLAYRWANRRIKK